MIALPVINCSAAMTVTFNKKTYNLVVGENQIDEIILLAGDNRLTFSGTGKVTVTYQEGWL